MQGPSTRRYDTAMADDTDSESEMLAVLTGLGMQDLWPMFQENKVGPKEVDGLITDDFRLLGVHTIGDQVRLKNACRNYVRGEAHPSPVVQRFIELTSGRRKKKALKTDVPRKTTRKLHVGWKHMSSRGVFMQVTTSKGGGTQTVAVENETDLHQLKNIVEELYFPDGMSHAKNLKLTEVKSFLASYTGAPLPESIGDEPFSVYAYFTAKKVSPLRVYLHTSQVKQDAGENVLATHTTEQLSGAVNAESSDDDFCDLGTPTILINRRRNCLKRVRTKAEPSCTPTAPVLDVENTSVCTSYVDTPVPSTSVDLNSASRPSTSSVSQTVPVEPMSVHTDAAPVPSTSAENTPAMQASTGSAYSSDNDHSDDSKCYIMDDETSETEGELQQAIKESLRPKAVFSEKLFTLKNEIISCKVPNPIIIHRQRLMESTKRALSRGGFKYTSPVQVQFTGEDGEDYGGPKREYLSLLMKDLHQSLVENGTFKHSVEKLEHKEYYFAGKCITWSILQGGPGFPYLSPMVIRILLNQEPKDLDIQQVPYEERKMLEKLQEADDIDEEMTDWLIDQGLNPPFNREKKQDILTLCLKQILYYRIHAELCQFREGLNAFGFLDALIEYPTGLETLLCYHTVKMSYEEAKKMIIINFSEEGSNHRKLEVDTAYAFELFLQDCTEGASDVNFEELLSFWTGAESMPPLGFDKKLEINFITGIDRLPVAHTCEMSLELARGLTPEDMNAKMVKAIRWGGEFHLV